MKKNIEIYDWYAWPWNRCKAVATFPMRPYFYVRCELKKFHDGDHAVERGMDIPRWTNVWVSK